MAIISFLSILISLILSLTFTPLLAKLALKVDAYKRTKTDMHQPPVSFLGGISIFFSFLIASLFISFRQGLSGPEVTGIITGSIIIILMGLVDDFVELKPGPKFFAQGLAVIALIIFGVRTSIAAVGELSNILVTFFWMFAIINAFNLLDIMDGLCCGIAVIAAGAFLILSFLSHNLIACILCSSLIGAGIGFLRYNLPPARIYLGDTGSQFLGFMLAAIAIIIDYAPLKREVALLTPLLVLGLPIFDTGFLILMRIVAGRPVTRKSRDHFALRLLTKGFRKPQVLLVMYLFALVFAGSSLIISRVSNQMGLVILIVIMFVCSIALKKMGAVKIDA